MGARALIGALSFDAASALRTWRTSQATLPSKAPNPPNHAAPPELELGAFGGLGGDHSVASSPATLPGQPTDPEAQAEWSQLPYGSERGKALAAARLKEGACRCCAGRRWWCGEGVQSAPRCMACHPPPPGLAFREKST
jgi:hypothetical protein